MADGHHDDERSLVVPFVVCDDNGGPYDAGSFVAGIYYGEAVAAAKLAPLGVSWMRYVPAGLVPQLDLLAMSEGVHIRSAPWADDPDQFWTLIEMRAAPFDEDDPS